MRKQKSRMGLFAVATLAAFAASSAACAAAGWTTPVSIVEIVQQPGSDQVSISTSGILSNPSGCASANGFYFSVINERHKRLFALLMAAQLSGQQVRMYVTGVCTSG
jgi:hypothetical protein